MSSSRNPVISISRILGMLFIIACHIIGYYTFIPGSSFLSQFFIAGVQLFIFISGYLYAGKVVTRFGKWYAARALTISLPAILLSGIVIISLIAKATQISTATIIAYCMDLEGVLFVSNHLTSVFKSIPSLDPLWFTTVIMLCYLLIPLLQKIKTPSSPITRAVSFISFLLVGIVMCAILFPWVNLTYFFFFAIGYFMGKARVLDKINTVFFLVYTLIFIASIAGRLILRRYTDGTTLYTCYTEFARFVVGTWFIAAIAFVHNKAPRIINSIANWKVTQWFDSVSFYIYLTHGIFCLGTFNLYAQLSLPFATCSFLILTLLSAITLKWVCSIISSPISSRLRA